MTATPVDTVNLRHWLERIEAGDLAARDELLRGIGGRLERLTRKMLRRFPGVHRWAQTDDVLQNAILRLLRALQEVTPANTREFFGLAATQIRRELLDLARHFSGAAFARYPSAEPGDRSNGDGMAQVADRAAEDGDLELWCRFHEAVEQLPPEEREVLGLVFYHGWTQAQIAELFQVDVRTVRRRWQSACLRLAERVGGKLPQP